MARSVLSNAFATEKYGVFAIVAVDPWGGSGGGTLPPPEAGALHGARHGASGAVPPVGPTASFIMTLPPWIEGQTSSAGGLTWEPQALRDRPPERSGAFRSVDDPLETRYHLPPERARA